MWQCLVSFSFHFHVVKVQIVTVPYSQQYKYIKKYDRYETKTIFNAVSIGAQIL